MEAQKIERLRPLAARCVWWKSADGALRYPDRVVAQVMNMGSFEDVQMLSAIAIEDDLRGVHIRAEAGELNPRSWHY
jgi:hypothetical protein